MPASTFTTVAPALQMPREPVPAAFPTERTSTEQPVRQTSNLRLGLIMPSIPLFRQGCFRRSMSLLDRIVLLLN